MTYGNYITRDKVLTKAVDDMIAEMYMRSQPPVDIKEYSKQYKDGTLDREKDRCYEWHYLPEPIQRQIVEDYLDAYGANDQFKKWCEFLIDNFKNGGHRTVYRDVFGTGENVRTGEETEKLHELIGEENAEKVYKLMDDFMGFYRTNREEMSIRSGIWYCPTSNPKTVIEKWGDKVTIDDSMYKGYDGEMWDYTYRDYYNGEITGIDEFEEIDDEDLVEEIEVEIPEEPKNED